MDKHLKTDTLTAEPIAAAQPELIEAEAILKDTGLIVVEGASPFKLARMDITAERMENLERDARIISFSLSAPKEVQGNPQAALGVAYQAQLWGFDPVAVASKAYITNGRLAWEAQLVAALINVKAPIVGRIRYSFHGEGSQRYCVASCTTLDGEKIAVPSPIIGQIYPKNSPLWVTNPDQQLSYYTGRTLARRHFPEILLGVYTPDELRTEAMRDVTPRTPENDPYADGPAPSFGTFNEVGQGGDSKNHPNAPEPSGGRGFNPRDAEPQDMGVVRERVAAEQARIVAMKGETPAAMVDAETSAAMREAAETLVRSKDGKRLKQYDQATFNTLNSAFVALFKDMVKPEPKTEG